MSKVNFKHLKIGFMTTEYESGEFGPGYYYYDEAGNLVIIEEEDPNHQTIFNNFISMEIEKK